MNDIKIGADGQDVLELNSVNAIQVADGMIAHKVDVEVFQEFIEAIVAYTRAIGSAVNGEGA